MIGRYVQYEEQDMHTHLTYSKEFKVTMSVSSDLSASACPLYDPQDHTYHICTLLASSYNHRAQPKREAQISIWRQRKDKTRCESKKKAERMLKTCPGQGNLRCAKQATGQAVGAGRSSTCKQTSR